MFKLLLELNPSPHAGPLLLASLHPCPLAAASEPLGPWLCLEVPPLMLSVPSISEPIPCSDLQNPILQACDFLLFHEHSRLISAQGLCAGFSMCLQSFPPDADIQ